MRLSSCLLAILALFNLATAYPTYLISDLENLPGSNDTDDKHYQHGDNTNSISKRLIGFNAAKQYVSNKGTNKFVAPNFAAGDQRGNCPGLNALANHGYLPHNGVGTISQFIDATVTVYGIGLDIATILSVYGAAIAGNGLKFSIGGKTPLVGSPIPLLLSAGRGLSLAHNTYDNDGSPTRGDLYQYGNSYKLVMSQFEDLFNLQSDQETANYNNIDMLADFRHYRMEQQIATNPYFFFAPVSGTIGLAGAYQFITLFSNHSAEHPEGRLDQKTLKSFFAITGSGPGYFTYTEGHEMIPDNWYRRAIGNEYTIDKLSLDQIRGITRYPDFVKLGGNTGTVNSFTGVDVGDLTGGAFNAKAFADPIKQFCFVHEAMQAVMPDLLKPLLAAILSIFSGLGCPILANQWDLDTLRIFPGFNLGN